ncbi:unnamed protein product [Soboliphyme baturini]|uniref:Choline transporter-like protein n=1 Tax=Soboliphyme baturini TaxID=241478 RepID=A0A183IEP1_9BILA|nr:unnamed protein product [Soboliphyme baturini]
MILVAFISISAGNVWSLVYGTDYFGNLCGRNNAKVQDAVYTDIDLSSKPYLFALNAFHPAEAMWICVEKCPSTWLPTPNAIQSFAQSNGSKLCHYSVPIEAYNSWMSYSNSSFGPCPVLPVFKRNFIPSFKRAIRATFTFSSWPFSGQPLMRRCVPSEIPLSSNLVLAIYEEFFGVINGASLLSQIFGDVIPTLQNVVFLCCFSFVISFMLFVVIGLGTKAALYVVFAITLILSLAATAEFGLEHRQMKRSLDHETDMSNGSQILAVEALHEHGLLICFYGCIGITGILLLCALLFVLAPLNLLSEIFVFSRRLLRYLPFVVFQGIITGLALAFVVIYGVFILLEISSIDPFEEALLSPFHFNLYGLTVALKPAVLWWYHFFGVLWTVEFIFALQHMMYSYRLSQWYFCRILQIGEAVSPLQQYLMSFAVVAKYHLGSVVLGSLSLTCTKVPRIVLITVPRLLACWSFITFGKFRDFCSRLAVFSDNLFRFFNPNAYLVTAMNGKSFFQASLQSYEITLPHAAEYSVVSSLVSTMLVFGKIAAALLSTLLACLIFKHDNSLHCYVPSLILTALVTYWITRCFLSVYETLIDSIFICYLESKRIETAIADGVPPAFFKQLQNLMKQSLKEPSRGCNSSVEDEGKGRISSV